MLPPNILEKLFSVSGAFNETTASETRKVLSECRPPPEPPVNETCLCRCCRCAVPEQRGESCMCNELAEDLTVGGAAGRAQLSVSLHVRSNPKSLVPGPTADISSTFH